MDKIDCKYARTGIVEVKTKEQVEIIKKVLGKEYCVSCGAEIPPESGSLICKDCQAKIQ